LYVCPVEAIWIHEGSGARYIDERICIGCNQCYDACPFTPKQAMIKAYKGEERITFIKCDLCKDQQEGPICFIPAESRKRLSKKDKPKKDNGEAEAI
jgi:Fe-S-cluster-containing hydrogenase component 2